MLPRLVIYNAISVDGRITGFPVDLGAYYGLISVWREDVTLTSSETILTAPEQLEPDPPDPATFTSPAPVPRDTRPIVAVVDSRGRLRCWQALRQAAHWRDAVALCAESTPTEYIEYLRARGIPYVTTGGERVDLRAALEELHERYGAKTVRMDSGGTLNGVVLRASLVDEVSVLVHPSMVGREAAGSLFRVPDPSAGDKAIPLRLRHCETLEGGVVWLRYDVVR
jgi:2,5-diamino-6-(ribosylamino)-4(3H)-pyrimidinone 5'-phosphate reductase